MAKSKKDFTLLLIALFCSSLAHAQKQVPAERKDSIDNGSNIIKIVGNHSNKGAANNVLVYVMLMSALTRSPCSASAFCSDPDIFAVWRLYHVLAHY